MFDCSGYVRGGCDRNGCLIAVVVTVLGVVSNLDVNNLVDLCLHERCEMVPQLGGRST